MVYGRVSAKASVRVRTAVIFMDYFPCFFSPEDRAHLLRHRPA
jgi:hypothetical protein